jgi:hypothetical protein
MQRAVGEQRPTTIDEMSSFMKAPALFGRRSRVERGAADDAVTPPRAKRIGFKTLPGREPSTFAPAIKIGFVIDGPN